MEESIKLLTKKQIDRMTGREAYFAARKSFNPKIITAELDYMMKNYPHEILYEINNVVF